MNEPANPFDTAFTPEGADPFALDLGSDAAMPDPFAEPHPAPAPEAAAPTGQPATPVATAAFQPPPQSQPAAPLPTQPAAQPAQTIPEPAPIAPAPPQTAAPAPQQAPAPAQQMPIPLFASQAERKPAERLREERTSGGADELLPLAAKRMSAVREDEMEKSEQTSVFAKLPVFEYGPVTEDIADVTQTFDQLRIAKADDFPELEDEKRVTWSVTYGKVTKTVSSSEAKKSGIGQFKASIESSKAFIDGLKTSKDKSPRCVVKPRVTAQSKGEALTLPDYKGVFTNIGDAYASGKPICIVPGNDGYLYEMRRSELGTFTTRTTCSELDEIRAGFIPALPRIPLRLTLSVIGFFRSHVSAEGSTEALVNILWDRQRRMFVALVPEQMATRTRVTADISDMPDPDRYLHYMDVHSHNMMPAKFSQTDDDDEKATRVYAVFGRFDRFMPEISVRISNGGKYLEIEPSVVFEPINAPYPANWNERVTAADTDDISGTTDTYGPAEPSSPDAAAITVGMAR